jgi:hypothetical protein
MFRTLFARPAALVLSVLALFAVPLRAHERNPLEVAAQFLALSEDQIARVVAIHQAVGGNTAPLVQEIAARRAILGELIDRDDPVPAEIGVLVLSIRALEEQILRVRQEAAAQIRAMLDVEQLGRVEAAAAARPLCKVIPALSALHLL